MCSSSSETDGKHTSCNGAKNSPRPCCFSGGSRQIINESLALIGSSSPISVGQVVPVHRRLKQKTFDLRSSEADVLIACFACNTLVSQGLTALQCDDCDAALCFSCAFAMTSVAKSSSNSVFPNSKEKAVFWTCKGCDETLCPICQLVELEHQNTSLGSCDKYLKEFCLECLETCPCASDDYSAQCKLCEKSYCTRCDDWFGNCRICDTGVCKECSMNNRCNKKNAMDVDLDSQSHNAECNSIENKGTKTMHYCLICELELCSDCREATFHCEDCGNSVCDVCYRPEVTFICDCQI